jgi:tetratricopeptide (TPR) repeat protein
MSPGPKQSRIAFALLPVMLCSSLQADYQSGLDAYNVGRYDVALQEWLQAAERPPGTAHPAIYAETHYAIGMLYWMGQGVTKDYFEAAKWLHKAGELGHAGAQLKLGYMYSEGLAVQPDYALALEWFDKAAKQGDMDAQYNLGLYYLNGWGTERDSALAARWLSAASAQGDKDAEKLLEELLPLKPEADAIVTADAAAPTESVASAGPVEAQQQAASGLTLLSPDWIARQHPEHYTIQVIGLRDLAVIRALIEGHEDWAPFASYVVALKNRPLHVLIQGVYPDVETARRARDKFPKDIQKTKNLWIRRFVMVQGAMNP